MLIKKLGLALLSAALSTSLFSMEPDKPQFSGCLKDFSLYTETLYWTACQDGIPYGTQSHIAPVTPGSPIEVRSNVKDPHNQWDWGYRVKLGYSLPCDCWGLSLNWTHFHTRSKAHHHEDFEVGAAFFTPAWGSTAIVDDTGGPDLTKSHWRLHLDVLDLELGKTICLSECFSIRPHIGVRGAWVHQSYRIKNFEEISEEEILIQRVHLKQDFEGAGLRAGLISDWDIGCGFSLYGSAAISALYGEFKLKSHNFLEFADFNSWQKDSFCGCRAITDATLGLKWKAHFCNNRYAVTFILGWEHHLFINQNQFEDLVKLSDSSALEPSLGETKNVQFHKGDLCLYGLTVGTKFEF